MIMGSAQLPHWHTVGVLHVPGQRIRIAHPGCVPANDKHQIAFNAGRPPSPCYYCGRPRMSLTGLTPPLASSQFEKGTNRQRSK